MAYKLNFLKGTKKQYLALNVIDANTFYYLDDSELYLGTIDLTHKSDFIDIFGRLDDLENLTPKYKTTEEWNKAPEQGETEKIPAVGEIIVYSDYDKDENGNPVPGIKIGDGKTSVSNLPFINGKSCTPLPALTIGNYVYDGTAPVTVPVYEGDII